jgi:ribosomal protein S12 methylthiotransferase accessory factor YcaO
MVLSWELHPPRSMIVSNDAPASKLTGPRPTKGKRISSENAQRHGLASSSGISLDFGVPALAALVEEARGFGFSTDGAEELVTRMAAARDVIDAKHASFKEKPEAERLSNMSAEALFETIKEIETPGSGVTAAERRAVFTPLY